MGAGAVGSAIGGYLSRNHEVLLVGRGAHMDAMADHGLAIDGILGSSQHTPLVCKEGALKDHPFLQKPLDWVLITVKSPSTRQATQALIETIPDPERPVWAHIQNGMGNLETIRETLTSGGITQLPIILSGMTITGYDIPDPGHVRITVYGGPGKIGWLETNDSQSNSVYPEAARSLVDILSETPLVFEYSDRMISFLWAKLLYNCCLNPLGALLKLPYGELRIEPALELIKEILGEAFALAALEKAPLFWASAQDYFDHLQQTLIPATAEHEPSMLADIQKGRATEIMAMNGFIVERSESHGLKAPVNSTIVQLIRSAHMKNG